MKRFLLSLVILSTTISLLQSQDRSIARGAEYGELYMTGFWYGIYNPIWGDPVYDTLRAAIYRLTEHGKKLTIQYDADYFANEYNPPGSVMIPNCILADATPGVVYNTQYYIKDSYWHTALWVSFDYGKNWTFREETGFAIYYSGIYNNNNQSIIYRGGGGMRFSIDFGQTWTKIENSGYTVHGDIGYNECEFFGMNYKDLFYTQTCFNIYTTIEIGTHYISEQSPDAYRGGKAGEVYVSSLFSEPESKVRYKVSFSADTGYTFRHVFVSEIYDLADNMSIQFMSDREPGVFYIVRNYYRVEDYNPDGWHTKVCVEYYRDYGETHVATYCHDLTKDYKPENNIEELTMNNEQLTIYPNPTTGELQILVNNEQLIMNNVEVFDVYGRNVSSNHLIITSSNHLINISHLHAGIYFVRITTEKGIITKKIIKI